MQELRTVLIFVGVLAIAALLFHGLWTSKKEGKSKFGERPLGKIDVEEDAGAGQAKSVTANQDDESKEARFTSLEPEEEIDPLISSQPDIDDMPSQTPSVTMEPESTHAPQQDDAMTVWDENTRIDDIPEADSEEHEPQDDGMPEVLVLNVHTAGNESFVGTRLFDSMQQNGLLYGEMNIFHRHADLSGTGKVLFSVANMMRPGTLEHDDPETFTTKGISFFMTLPCFGDPEQNFKLMLKTAQQIADDMGGNVLDDGRNLMTPDRLEQYRQQIKNFKQNNA
ncbi:MAG: cell division protein ZipA [Vibrio sp.]